MQARTENPRVLSMSLKMSRIEEKRCGGRWVTWTWLSARQLLVWVPPIQTSELEGAET